MWPKLLVLSGHLLLSEQLAALVEGSLLLEE
jgi:hypothetical protein